MNETRYPSPTDYNEILTVDSLPEVVTTHKSKTNSEESPLYSTYWNISILAT